MVLDLTACLVFVAAIAAAVVIIRRKLPIAGEASAGEAVCLKCRSPARLLSPDSFLCPGCRCDVRTAGIGLDRPKGATKPFWQLVNFSAALSAIALVTTGVLSFVLGVNYVSVQSDLQFTGEPYQNLQLLLIGERPGDGPVHGELYADLFLTNGQVVTLAIQSPSRRYRLIDVNGQESALSQEAFGQEAALRWLSMAGLSAADTQTRHQAGWMATQIENYLNGNGRIPVSPPEDRPRCTGGYSGSSNGSGPPKMLLPFSVIGWSLIWLAGLTRILRRSCATATGASTQREPSA